MLTLFLPLLLPVSSESGLAGAFPIALAVGDAGEGGKSPLDGEFRFLPTDLTSQVSSAIKRVVVRKKLKI